MKQEPRDQAPMNPEAWGMAQPQESSVGQTTLRELDELARQIKAARDQYAAAKAVAAEAEKVKSQLEFKMIQLLKANNRTSYASPEGTVLYYTKEQYTVPKDPEAKAALRAYIVERYGEDVYNGMSTIHSQTLNAWANKETETGEVMQIPGLEQPQVVEVFSFRSK